MIEDPREARFSPTGPFRFCPADGTPLGEPRPSGGATCPGCGRSWYRNSAPSVGAAIAEEGWVLAIGFRARIVDGEPHPADDVAEVRWISAGEVDGTDFAWEHDRKFVRAALREER